MKDFGVMVLERVRERVAPKQIGNNTYSQERLGGFDSCTPTSQGDTTYVATLTHRNRLTRTHRNFVLAA